MAGHMDSVLSVRKINQIFINSDMTGMATPCGRQIVS